MKPTAKQVENWRTVPHWYHVDTGAHKCAKKAPSGKWVEGKAPDDMPPIRVIGIESGQKVKTCNTLTSSDLALQDVDIDYYVREAEKLVIK